MSIQRESTIQRFETAGPTWAERANSGELNAVLSPAGSENRNRFLHAVELFGAKVALALDRERDGNTQQKARVLLDFGCGTGRFMRFFGKRGYDVIGIEITVEMLREAQRFGLPKRSALLLTDGVSIPLPAQSVDMVWICGVLKYSLFQPGTISRGGTVRGLGHDHANTNSHGDGTPAGQPFVPVYREIARELYRVLKPEGLVVNVEMYVDVQPEIFIRDFEEAGFVTKQARVLQRYGRPETLCQSPRLPLSLVIPAGQVCAAFRFRFDDPKRPVPGLRDYLFAWVKSSPSTS